MESIKESPRKGKRYRVIMKDGTHYDFGLKGGSTYLDHKDKQKRDAYIARHMKNKNEGELIESLTPSPALFSMYLLWGPYTNIEDNYNYLNGLFNNNI